MISKNIAEKILAINWKQGIKSEIFGIVGAKQDMYIHKIDIEVVGLENSKRNIDIGIVDHVNFGILLGQIGFFEFFNVAFCYSKKYFYINPS